MEKDSEEEEVEIIDFTDMDLEDKAGNITYYNADLYMVNNEIHSLEPEPEPGPSPDNPEDDFQDEDGNVYHYVRDEDGNYVFQNSACYVRRVNLKNYLKHWKSGYSVSASGHITGELNSGGNVSGALESYSKWYLDEDLQKKIYTALYNMENDTDHAVYTQTFDRDTIKQIQDEVFADPSKMQMDYIKSTWMKQYCNF